MAFFGRPAVQVSSGESGPYICSFANDGRRSLRPEVLINRKEVYPSTEHESLLNKRNMSHRRRKESKLLTKWCPLLVHLCTLPCHVEMNTAVLGLETDTCIL